MGIEIWSSTLDSESWRDEDGYKRGQIETELGFTKHSGQWVLATRRAFYDHDDAGKVSELVKAQFVTPLLEASRDMRLEALAHFPELANSLNQAAEDAIKTIEDAEKFVNAPAPEADCEAFLRDALGKTLEELALPARAIKALKNAELNLVVDLVQKNEGDLEHVANLGEKSIEEIKTALAALGLSLGMRIDPNVLGMLGRGSVK